MRTLLDVRFALWVFEYKIKDIVQIFDTILYGLMDSRRCRSFACATKKFFYQCSSTDTIEHNHIFQQCKLDPRNKKKNCSVRFSHFEFPMMKIIDGVDGVAVRLFHGNRSRFPSTPNFLLCLLTVQQLPFNFAVFGISFSV